MGFYERYVLPWLIDRVCRAGVVREQRARLVPLARGRVLEIGIGSGLNLPYYDPSQTKRVWGLDPVATAFSRAARRAAQAGLSLELLAHPGEAIPAGRHAFDTVLVTYTLCSVEDPARVLREARRVLRPEGRLLFCEHGRAPDAGLQRWQDRLTPWWKKMAGGCHLNRPVLRLIQEAGFRVEHADTAYLGGLQTVVNFNYRGVARPV